MQGPDAQDHRKDGVVKLSFLKLATEAHELSVSGGEAGPPGSDGASVTPAGRVSAATGSDAPLASIGVSCEPSRAASAVGHS